MEEALLDILDKYDIHKIKNKIYLDKDTEITCINGVYVRCEDLKYIEKELHIEDN